MKDATSHPAADATRLWVRSWVIREDLCPFAAGVEIRGLVAYRVHEANHGDPVAFALHHAIELLATDPTEIATTLLVYSSELAVFSDFLDAAADLEGALSAAGADGILQVATFHPDYVFEGCAADDPANATNRSPFPTLHLLREADVAEALAAHPDAANIAQRNVDKLRNAQKLKTALELKGA